MHVAALIAMLLTTAAPPAPDSRETCRSHSIASFPSAYEDPDNLRVGPLVMVGAGRRTPAATVREFGGNKFPVLLRAGHRATIELPQDHASLGYGRLPEGIELEVRHGHRVVAFTACPRRKEPVTFWSGFVLADRPQCVRLRVWVDRERAPRSARIALGESC